MTQIAVDRGQRREVWWLPDEARFIWEIPKTSVGKCDKKHLRRIAARIDESRAPRELSLQHASPG